MPAMNCASKSPGTPVRFIGEHAAGLRQLMKREIDSIQVDLTRLDLHDKITFSVNVFHSCSSIPGDGLH